MERIALVSDAGVPLISDLGYVLVTGAIAVGGAVEVLSGRSAAITALVASGFAAEAWRFVGFLLRKRSDSSPCCRRRRRSWLRSRNSRLSTQTGRSLSVAS